MRQILRYASIVCKSDEKRVDVYINGTRLVGCEHSDAEQRKYTAIMIGLLVPFGVFLACALFCIFRSRCRDACCTAVQDRLDARLDEAAAKEDDEYVRNRLGVQLHDFVAGQLTEDVKFAIGQARAQDGPLTNGRFARFFQRHVVKRDMANPSWMATKCFEIVNIQPMADVCMQR